MWGIPRDVLHHQVLVAARLHLGPGFRCRGLTLPRWHRSACRPALAHFLSLSLSLSLSHTHTRTQTHTHSTWVQGVCFGDSVKSHHSIDCRASCGANLVTLPSKLGRNKPLELHRAAMVAPMASLYTHARSCSLSLSLSLARSLFLPLSLRLSLSMSLSLHLSLSLTHTPKETRTPSLPRPPPGVLPALPIRRT